MKAGAASCASDIAACLQDSDAHDKMSYQVDDECDRTTSVFPTTLVTLKKIGQMESHASAIAALLEDTDATIRLRALHILEDMGTRATPYAGAIAHMTTCPHSRARTIKQQMISNKE